MNIDDFLERDVSPLIGEVACRKKFNSIIIGSDEAGRGPLAGPVTAAAVILPDNFMDIDEFKELNDSKKLTEKKREMLFPLIKKHAVAWSIQESSAKKIDEINILQASLLAMYKSIRNVCQQIDVDINSDKFHALIDGNKLVPQLDTSVQDFAIKGDGRIASIAAASVLAKVSRDHTMVALDKKFPEYGFAKHKGYPTKEHVEAVKIHGYSEAHRKSFHVKSLSQMELNL